MTSSSAADDQNRRRAANRVGAAFVLAFAAILLVGSGARLARAAASVPDDPDKIVATIGGHQITQKELDDKLRPQMAKLQNRIFEMKRQMLELMADQYLVEHAAAKARLSPDAYLKKEVDEKVAKVTDAEAKKYFDEHKLKDHYRYDEVKDKLIAALSRRRVQEQQAALVDKLRKEASVKILLDTPRVVVDGAGHPTLGSDNAPVTIVEFGDFQCPFCARAESSLKAVREKFGDKVRLTFVDFPLPMHNHAVDAATAARCANEQGKFWPYHDALFADQSKLARVDLKATAKRLGLDRGRFDECFDKRKYEAAVRQDQSYGQQLGIDGTPTFYINGRMLTGVQSPSAIAQIVDDELQNPPGKQSALR